MKKGESKVFSKYLRRQPVLENEGPSYINQLLMVNIRERGKRKRDV